MASRPAPVQPDGRHASYRAGDGAAIGVAVSAIAPDEAEAVAPISRFPLTVLASATNTDNA